MVVGSFAAILARFGSPLDRSFRTNEDLVGPVHHDLAE
jgi:hypothetical protein